MRLSASFRRRAAVRTAIAGIIVSTVAVAGALVAPSASAAGASPAGAHADADIPGVIITEVEATNWSGTKDEDKKSRDWAELYNPGTAPADLSYWGLSNKDGAHFRWVFPEGTVVAPGSYLTVWLSKQNRAVAGKELHTDFNLDNGEDPLVLSIPDGTAGGTVVDSTPAVRARTDQSICRRSSSATAAWGICTAPTFGKANGSTWSAAMAESPRIELASGIYPTRQSATITVPAGTQVRYTLDGSEPTATSTLYAGAIPIATSASLRAAAFGTALAPSFTQTATYVIDPAGAAVYAGQRTIFVSMSPSDLAAYRAKSKSRSIASAVELRENDGSVILKTDAESQVAGQLGSLNAQATVPLDITLRDARGTSEFRYPLLSQKGEQSFTRFRLRNGGSDWWSARLRDSFAQSLMADSPSLYADYTPVAMFVNGQYTGLMDLREREDETLVASSTGTDDDAVDFLSDGDATSGGAAAEKAWRDFTGYVARTDFTVAANYAEVQKQIDVENLAANTAFYGWSAIWDWPWRNTHVWRSSALDDRWRYQVHDFDISMDSPDKAYSSNTKATVNMYSGSGIYSSGNDVFAKLMKNADFKRLYINTVADQFNDQLRPEIANARLDQMAALVKPYVGSFRAWQPALGTTAQWESVDIARLRAFVNSREGILDQQTRTEFGLTARQTVTVGINDAAMGTVDVNSIDGVFANGVTSWTGKYYPQVPITLTARTRPGFAFVGWQGESNATTSRITATIDAATSLTAVFAPTTAPATPIFAAAPARSNVTGDAVDVTVAATDPVGSSLRYTAKGLPKGVELDAASGHLTGRVYAAGSSNVRITASNGVSSSTSAFVWTVTDRPGTGLNSAPLPGKVSTEWFTNKTLTGSPFLVDSSAIGVDAAAAAAPRTGMPTSSWSTRWSTTLTPSESGVYTFHTDTTKSDGVRVIVGSGTVIDDWAAKKLANDGQVTLTAGIPVQLRVEFFDAGGAAKLTLRWTTPSGAGPVRIPATAVTAAPVVSVPATVAPATVAPSPTPGSTAPTSTPVATPGATPVPSATATPTPTATPTRTPTPSATPPR